MCSSPVTVYVTFQRRLGGTGESSDRLLTRHLPAWVASGLLNFGLIALAYGLVLRYDPEASGTAGKGGGRS